MSGRDSLGLLQRQILPPIVELSLGIRGIYNVEIGERPRAAVRRLYEETLGLAGLADVCPLGRFSLAVGPSASPLSGVLTFAGAGGSIRAVTFAIGRGQMANWRARLVHSGTRVVGRAWQFDEEHLCFVDDADFDLALVEVAEDKAWYGTGASDAILGFRGVEVAAGPTGELESLFAAIDVVPARLEKPLARFEFARDGGRFALDVLRSDDTPAQPDGTGQPPQRLSFEVTDLAALDHLRRRLGAAGFVVAPIVGRSAGFHVRLRSLRDLEIGFLVNDRLAP